MYLGLRDVGAPTLQVLAALVCGGSELCPLPSHVRAVGGAEQAGSSHVIWSAFPDASTSVSSSPPMCRVPGTGQLADAGTYRAQHDFKHFSLFR